MPLSIGDRVVINDRPLFIEGIQVCKDGVGKGPGIITDYSEFDGCYEIEMEHCPAHILYFAEDHLERVN